jgi:hypothetical protein
MSFLRPEAKAQLVRWRETLAGLGCRGAGAVAGAHRLWRALRPRRRPDPRRRGAGRGGGAAGAVPAGVGRAGRGADRRGAHHLFRSLGRRRRLARPARLARGGPGPGCRGGLHADRGGRRAARDSVDARGADRLFDVFAALPGFDTRAMLAAMRPPVRERTAIWQRTAWRCIDFTLGLATPVRPARPRPEPPHVHPPVRRRPDREPRATGRVSRLGLQAQGAWRIGTEHEKFGYCKDTLRPLPYEGPRSVRAMLEGMRDRFGWTPVFEGDNIIGLEHEGANVSLEPGRATGIVRRAAAHDP